MDTEWDCVVVGGGAATDATQHGQLTAAGVVVDERTVADLGGDLSAQMPQVAAAGASGSMAAAAVVQSLLADQFGLPVPPWPIEKEDADAHA